MSSKALLWSFDDVFLLFVWNANFNKKFIITAKDEDIVKIKM